MQITKYILIIGILISFLSCQKEQENINDIGLSYYSALRIPFNEVHVDISLREAKDSAIVFINCKPLIDSTEWEYSKIDTIFLVDKKTFDNLAASTAQLENINIDKAFAEGLDGSVCKLEYGAKGKNSSYSFWAAESDTEKRGLTGFMELYKQILKVAHLQEKDILED